MLTYFGFSHRGEHIVVWVGGNHGQFVDLRFTPGTNLIKNMETTLGLLIGLTSFSK